MFQQLPVKQARAYLAKTVRNLTVNRLRRERERTQRELRGGHLVTGSYFDDRLTSWEDEQYVEHLLESLTSMQREVVKLVMDGLSVHEIGTKLGIEESTVRVHLSRARRSITDCGRQGQNRIAANAGGVNFWDCLNADQKKAFRAKAHQRVFAPGARLMQEGEHGDHVAVILSGLTEIRVCEDGIERVVAKRRAGQLIGERAALEVNPRSATVAALQTVVALVMRTADFAAFISTYPAVLKVVEGQIYTRLREGPTEGGPAVPEPMASLLPRSLRLTGQNCTVVRTDVVAPSADERDDEGRQIIRRETLAMTQRALGPAWDKCRYEDRGDGLLIVVPPDIPTAQVIERLLTVLPPSLKRHNRTHSDSGRIQLLVAVDVGSIEEDVAGVSGKSIISVSRMLDAPAFKQAMASQGAVLGVVVSPFVYQAHIQPGGSLIDPVDYTEVPVQVKETRGSAWMQLIGPPGVAPSLREQLMRSDRYSVITNME